MAAPAARRRAIVIARPHGRAELVALAAEGGWEAVEADGFGHAHFLLTTMSPEGAVAWDEAGGQDFLDGLGWFGEHLTVPPILVARRVDEAVLAAMHQGVLWVPPESLRSTPRLLGTLLDQAEEMGRRFRAATEAKAALRESEARVERLLSMLWESTPIDGMARWCSQRHVMERLDEEVERCRRGGAPMAVVLGELSVPTELPPSDADRLARWMAGAVASGKRRCDVAGHYGRRGFLMVLPQTTSEQAAGACRRLRQILAHPPHPLTGVNAHFALAEATGKEASVPVLLRCAEERLERAREKQVDLIAE